MQKMTLITLALLFSALPAISAQAQPTGCAAKKQALQQQLSYAKEAGNVWRITRLQRALDEVNADCHDDRLRAERQYRIEAKRARLNQREAELKQAMLRGDERKIAQQQRKRDEARADLADALAELRR